MVAIREAKKINRVVSLPPLRCPGCGSLRIPTPSGIYIICPKAIEAGCDVGMLAINPWNGPLYLTAMKELFPRCFPKSGGGWFIEVDGKQIDVVLENETYEWKARKKAGLPPEENANLTWHSDKYGDFYRYQLVAQKRAAKDPQEKPKTTRPRIRKEGDMAGKKSGKKGGCKGK